VDAEPRDFYLFKVLRAHILPLTNCAFNKSGDRFITGSYDRTCKVRVRGAGAVHASSLCAAGAVHASSLLRGWGGACK
jgi:hypothetical protein